MLPLFFLKKSFLDCKVECILDRKATGLRFTPSVFPVLPHSDSRAGNEHSSPSMVESRILKDHRCLVSTLCPTVLWPHGL